MLYFFFFNDTATTEIYTLSLHDALPISDINLFRYCQGECAHPEGQRIVRQVRVGFRGWNRDRKSTRLNSSHLGISYAVFCLKKKNNFTLPHSGNGSRKR